MKLQEFECPSCLQTVEDILDPTEVIIIICSECDVIMTEIEKE